jgi:hypothetical protein
LSNALFPAGSSVKDLGPPNVITNAPSGEVIPSGVATTAPLPTNVLPDIDTIPPIEGVVADYGAQLGANLELNTYLSAEVGTHSVARSTKEHGGRKQDYKIGLGDMIQETLIPETEPRTVRPRRAALPLSSIVALGDGAKALSGKAVKKNRKKQEPEGRSHATAAAKVGKSVKITKQVETKKK